MGTTKDETTTDDERPMTDDEGLATMDYEPRTKD
jgi:hypothetical protein